eukprot:3905789-Pleurochrysis_carterae.AAC.2
MIDGIEARCDSFRQFGALAHLCSLRLVCAAAAGRLARAMTSSSCESRAQCRAAPPCSNRRFRPSASPSRSRQTPRPHTRSSSSARQTCTQTSNLRTLLSGSVVFCLRYSFAARLRLYEALCASQSPFFERAAAYACFTPGQDLAA